MESKCPDEALRMCVINLNLCLLRMLEDTFSLGAAHLRSSVSAAVTVSRLIQIPLPKIIKYYILRMLKMDQLSCPV